MYVSFLLLSSLHSCYLLQYGDYKLAINLVAAGKIDLKPLVTHRFRFEEAVEAFEANRAGKSKDGKPVIKAIISGPDVDPNDY